MNRPCRLLAALWTVTWLVATTGAENTPSKPEDRGAPSLARQAHDADWWHAAIVWGRLRFTSTRSGTVVDALSAGGRTESISLLAESSCVALAYRRTRAEQTVTVEVHRNGAIALTRQYGPNERRTAFTFAQPVEGPITAQLDTASSSETFEAATLWHLCLAQPELCREQLVPLLAIVDPTRAMEGTLAAIETELRSLGAACPLGARPAWTTWVESLSADCFHRREAAHHALLDAGPAILWHLDRWSEHPSAERRHGLARVRRALMLHPAGAAAWLAGDPNLAGALAP